MNTFDKYHILPGSERKPLGGEKVSQPHPQAHIRVTLLLRSSRMLSVNHKGERCLSRDEFAQLHSAIEADIQKILEFASYFELFVISVKKEQRLVCLQGPLNNGTGVQGRSH